MVPTVCKSSIFEFYEETFLQVTFLVFIKGKRNSFVVWHEKRSKLTTVISDQKIIEQKEG